MQPYGIKSVTEKSFTLRQFRKGKFMRTFVILNLIIIFLAGQVLPGDQVLSPEELKHRMGTLVVKSVPGVTVRVKQLEHEFWFGTAISQQIFTGKVNSDDKQHYLFTLKSNFNAAVHENALKWYSTEKTRNKLTYDNADTMLTWCEENGLRLRGHCVFWCVDKFVQPWIKELNDDDLRVAVERRAIDVMRRYRGKIPEYDVNNEMLHGRYYKNHLGDTIRHEMFDWCRETDPNAILYVNDYGILGGGDLDAYEKQISDFIEAGVPVGGIGLQGHFGDKGVDPAQVKHVLDRLAKFNLPIKITEFDINTRDEEIKAMGLVDLYTTAFAHPTVEGILMWGFWEGSHWRPDAAIWDKDWRPTRAAEAYRDLVYKKWWTSRKGQTDETGIFRTPVFFGRYEVTVEGHLPSTVWIGKKEGSIRVDMTTLPGL